MQGSNKKTASIVRSEIWFIPAMSLVGATLLAVLTTAIDRQLAGTGFFQDLFSRNPEAVRTALSVVASSILTFTALVFTITMVVVQQAANRLSPRVMRAFLEDRMSQATLGIFTGTFAYSLLVLRAIRSPSEGASFVPGISVAIVFVAVFVSIGIFVAYLHHVTQSLQVGRLVERIARETQKSINALYPVNPESNSRGFDRTGEWTTVAWPDEAGVLQDIDMSALVEAASSADVDVEVLLRTGDFIPAGAPVLRVRGDAEGVHAGKLTEPISVGPTRSISSDVAFGLRQLVDVAERALSPGINDPTTAVQALDRIHDLVRTLAKRPIPSPRIYDDGDGTRVVTPTWSWDDIVGLAFDEIRHYGADSIQVTRKLESIIDDLLDIAGPERAPALQQQRELIAKASDPQGQTPGCDSPPRAVNAGIGSNRST